MRIDTRAPGWALEVFGYGYASTGPRSAYVTFHGAVNDSGATSVDLTDAARIISADMSDMGYTGDQPECGYVIAGAYATVALQASFGNDGVVTGGVDPSKASLWTSRLFLSHKPSGSTSYRNIQLRPMLRGVSDVVAFGGPDSDGDVIYGAIQNESGQGGYQPFPMGVFPVRFDEDTFEIRYDRPSQQTVTGLTGTFQIHTFGILVPGRKDNSWPKIPTCNNGNNDERARNDAAAAVSRYQASIAALFPRGR